MHILYQLRIYLVLTVFSHTCYCGTDVYTKLFTKIMTLCVVKWTHISKNNSTNETDGFSKCQAI